MREKRSTLSTKKKRMYILPLLLLLGLSLSVAQTDELGCCGNPNAGFATCDTDSLVSRDQDCCPSRNQFRNYYSSSTNPFGPANEQECQQDYFLANTDCEQAPFCSFGCCCTDLGGSVRVSATCIGADATFFEGQSCEAVNCQIPECNDGVDNDGNGCADLADSGCLDLGDPSESGGTCAGTGGECDNPGYSPQLSNLIATLTKGKRQVDLQWVDECGQNALSYDILRCEGDGCTNFQVVGSSTSTSFLDVSDDLKFDTVYTYQIMGHYSPQTATPTITTTVNLGNLECYFREQNGAFCIQPGTYNTFKDYLLTNFPNLFSELNFLADITTNFGSKFNKGYNCDQINTLTFAGITCSADQICVVRDGQPQCLEQTDCTSPNTNPFDLYGSLTQCENQGYCFFDRSATTVDRCFSCDPFMACYDYKSQNSCERDNCVVGNCQWNSLSDDIGTGVCINTFEDRGEGGLR